MSWWQKFHLLGPIHQMFLNMLLSDWWVYESVNYFLTQMMVDLPTCRNCFLVREEKQLVSLIVVPIMAVFQPKFFLTDKCYCLILCVTVKEERLCEICYNWCVLSQIPEHVQNPSVCDFTAKKCHGGRFGVWSWSAYKRTQQSVGAAGSLSHSQHWLKKFNHINFWSISLSNVIVIYIWKC